MSGPGLWERLRKARVVQVFIAYLIASWVVLQVAEILQESLSLPDWVLPPGGANRGPTPAALSCG